MFDLNDANDNIKIEFILSKINEFDIWKRYCSNFSEINKPFLSELYKDRNPDVRIYYNGSNRLVYKDHGNEDHFDCFGYIQVKYQCNFKESLKIVYSDFKLGSIKYDILPQLVLNNQPEELKLAIEKPFIEIIKQPWTLTDYDYWNQYGIPLDLLEKEEIYSCKLVYLHKNGNTITYTYSKKCPIYAFAEYDIDLNFIGYKIYFPLNKKGKKWLNNSSAEAIQGIKSINRNGGILGITKAKNDTICYKLLGIEAIAPYNESGDFNTNRIYELFEYYDFIFINFDPDKTGIDSTLLINKEWNLPYFYIDEAKDLSDYIKLYGLEKAKVMINNKLNKIYERS